MKIKQSMIEIRPEDELLFCCARTKTSEEVGDRIKVLIRKNLDWNYLMKSAFHHKVVPLLYQNLRRISPSKIPEKCLNELQKYYEFNAKRNLFLTVELIKLLRLLEEKKIFAIPYKGPAIAILAYRDISLRQFSDLDILVHQNDYLKTMHFFLEKGYRLKAEYSWECSLIDANYGVCVDLHRGIIPKKFPVFLDFQAMKQRLEVLQIGAGGIMTFCPEDMLIILCIQLAKDGWEHSYKHPICLSKLCDLSELMQAHPDMNWRRVFKDTKKIGCWRILLVSLSLIHVVFGTPIPKLPPRSLKYLGDLSDDIYNKLIHQTSINNVELLSMEKFHFKIRERWQDKLYPYYFDFKQRLIPNERDRALIPLPESLYVIYYAIRPIRLMIDYGQLALKIVKEKFFTWKR